MHFGIDYGSKLAGTTVVTWDDGDTLHQRLSTKKQDADQMILDSVSELQPQSIFIDAPLSLPAAYFGLGDDYHYRAVDRLVGAMSPMFLGGLTARAMKLKSQIQLQGISVYETYPSAYVRHHESIKKIYSKKDKACIDMVCPVLLDMIPHMCLAAPPASLHALDSLITWISGWRYTCGKARVLGDVAEGVIIY